MMALACHARALSGWAFSGGSFGGAELRFGVEGTIELLPDAGLASDRDRRRPPVLLPGFVNAHSHAFQRVLRGRVEARRGDFWTWRDSMYRIALKLGPGDLRVVARASFLEMVLAGFTGVVEFHYLHHDAEGRPYQDPNELALAVLDAAEDVGIRICLLQAAYARADRGRELEPAQRRFADPTTDAFLARAERLRHVVSSRGPASSFGVALHSVRAVPRAWLLEIARWAEQHDVPLHAHVAEQPREVERCLAEYGRRPVELLDDLGVLGPRFTAVHAIHIAAEEIRLLAGSGSAVCACPSTEANLGDGFVPAVQLTAAGVPICIGTDSHAAVDPFEEVRELDYRERLRLRSREGAAPAATLLAAAAAVGAERAGWAPVIEAPGSCVRRNTADAGPGGTRTSAVGQLAPGFAGDVVVLDGTHPALAGSDCAHLAEHLLVAGSAALVKDVYVAGRRVVESGRHPAQDRILRDFEDLQRRLWRE